MDEALQPPTLNTLGGFSVLKLEWKAEGAHISKMGSDFGHYLGVHFRMSQLVGIHVLAKQKDNYASAWCEMCS